VLCAFLALVAAWLALAVEELARAGVAVLSGARWLGLSLSQLQTLTASVERPANPGAFTTAGVALGGPLAVVACGLLAAAALRYSRAAGWARALLLEFVVLSLMWVPTALAAGALPGGSGPVAELYRELGEPQAGRWAALALALVALRLMAAPAAARAVATGRAWMRADGREFRRRLVRVVAGYPLLAGLGAVVLAAGWMAPAAAAVWLGLVLAALVLTTR
jgi:hypothetical protein